MSDDDSRHAAVQAVVGWGMVATIAVLGIALLFFALAAVIAGMVGW